MKKNIRNENGMSLVSAIGLMAVIGVGIIGALQLVKMSEKGGQLVKNKGDAISLTSMVETRVKSMFLDTKDAQGKLTTGVCSLVDVTTKDSQLTNVFIKLPSVSKPLLSSDIWNQAFSDFEEVRSDCKIANGYGKCFKLKADTLSKLGISDTTYKNLNPEFQIDIRTMYTNPVTADTFREIKGNGITKYDLKTIGFQYSVRANYHRTTDAKTSAASEYLVGFIWAGDVGVCEVDNRKVSLTANSFGDPTNSVLFNLAGFSADSKAKTTAPPINVVMLNTQIRSGILGGSLGSQFLTSRDTASDETRDSGPAYSACNEDRFQCPQLGANSRNYQKMRHLLRIGYQIPNILQNTGSSVEFAPSLAFKGTNAYELKANYAQSFTLGDYRYSKGQDGWYKTNINNSSIPLRIGSEDMLQAEIGDIGSPGQANNVCRNICVPQSNFNSNVNNHLTSNLSYRVKVAGVSPEQSTFEVASGPVACTACYMKNCDQFGLGTFGPMHEQPTEPLDANIPECFQHEDHYRNFYESKLVDLGPSSAGKCISATLREQDQSGLSLQAEDCGQPKSVMCFAFGKHLLAREATLTGAKMQQKPFAEASDICFSLGREILKKEPLRVLLAEQGNADQTAADFLGVAVNNLGAAIDESQRINFINISSQGSYFAPVGLNQEARLREYAQKTGETANLLSASFWVNLKTDSAGYIYAPAPRIANAAKDSQHKWGVHYNGAGNLVVSESSSSLGLVNNTNDKGNDDTDSKVGLLFHSHRFKGLEFARSWSPLAKSSHDEKSSLRSLCRRNFYPHEVFVTKEKTHKFNQASSLCKNEGGFFLPPTTTAGWEKALLLVNENASIHPFPNRQDAVKNPVWVNLVEGGTDGIIHMGQFLSGSVRKFAHSNGNGFFSDEEEKDEKGKAKKYDIACFNKEKGEITIEAYGCGRGNRMLTQQEVIAASDPSNKVLRTLLYIAFEKRGNHSDKKVRLY